VNETRQEHALEYVLAMVEFLDDAKSEIQDNLYAHLLEDAPNYFLKRVRNLLRDLFKQFCEFEHSHPGNTKPLVQQKYDSLPEDFSPEV
jgi:hypothetical protein